jgi:hypothetical protein
MTSRTGIRSEPTGEVGRQGVMAIDDVQPSAVVHDVDVAIGERTDRRAARQPPDPFRVDVDADRQDLQRVARDGAGDADSVADLDDRPGRRRDLDDPAGCVGRQAIG